MNFFITLALLAVAAYALPVDFTLPPLSDEQKAKINEAVEKKLAELPQEQQDAAHQLLDKIKKAAEENPEAFKAAVVKAFNNIPESAKQQIMTLRAHLPFLPNSSETSPPLFIKMMLHGVTVALLFLPQTLAINCHVCAGRDMIGAVLFPVLQSLGAGSLIAPAGNCSDNAQLCPTTNYCFKRIDTYHIQDGSGWSRAKAHYYSKGCDINAVAGSTVAYQLNKCVKYQEQTANGYKVVRKICACNDKDLCNGSYSASFFAALLALVAASLFLY